jgi:hydrogenase expression/formation protein HypC
VSNRPRLPLTDESARQLAHCDGEVCITCSDQAVEVRVVRLLDADLAMVATGAGTEEQVSVALVDAGPGDTILVHAKEAIAVVGR